MYKMIPYRRAHLSPMMPSLFNDPMMREFFNDSSNLPTMNVDVHEEENEYVLEADLPRAHARVDDARHRQRRRVDVSDLAAEALRRQRRAEEVHDDGDQFHIIFFGGCGNTVHGSVGKSGF